MTHQPWHYRDGELDLIGELCRPTAPANGCAVLVVHEADGIGGNVRGHCARLAALGYVAAAADMHGGGRVLDGEAMGRAVATFRADTALFRRRVTAAFDALCAAEALPPSRVAAIGFCFGGAAVLELARSGAPVPAVASFHGLLTTAAPAAPDTIHARILATTGVRDPLVPAADIDAFREEMARAGADWHLLLHGRAKHSFTNRAVDRLGDDRMAYDPLAHRLSWGILIDFLADTFEDPAT